MPQAAYETVSTGKVSSKGVGEGTGRGLHTEGCRLTAGPSLVSLLPVSGAVSGEKMLHSPELQLLAGVDCVHDTGSPCRCKSLWQGP